jgi:hypothetical protein
MRTGIDFFLIKTFICGVYSSGPEVYETVNVPTAAKVRKVSDNSKYLCAFFHNHAKIVETADDPVRRNGVSGGRVAEYLSSGVNIDIGNRDRHANEFLCFS